MKSEQPESVSPLNEERYAAWEIRILNDGQPALDLSTIRAAHEFWEFQAEDDVDVDAWFHAHLTKALRAAEPVVAPRPPQLTHCTNCGTALGNASGIGLFCPNRSCPIADGPFPPATPASPLVVGQRPPHPEMDGTCSVCGYEWENPFEVGEHVCPPGFNRKPVPTDQPESNVYNEPEAEAVHPAPPLKDLRDWLRNKSEEMFTHANGRRESGVKSLVGVSAADLKAARRIAEKMAGRKLDIDDSPAAAQESAEMQDRIADKLEKEARQLSGWSDLLAAQQPTLSPPELAPLLREARGIVMGRDGYYARDLEQAERLCSIPGLAVVRKKGE